MRFVQRLDSKGPKYISPFRTPGKETNNEYDKANVFKTLTIYFTQR